MTSTTNPDPQRTLERPLAPGATLQLSRGGVTLLFERQGGQCRMMRLVDGQPEREVLVGTGGDVVLLTEVFLPERPLILDISPEVVLAPGGWLKGYFSVPLGWNIHIRGRGGRARFLEKMPPADLPLAFLGNAGKGYAHPLSVRLFPRRPYPKDPSAMGTIPLHLVNRGKEWVDVERLYLPLADLTLTRLGRLFCADPVRLSLNKGNARLSVHKISGRSTGEAAS